MILLTATTQTIELVTTSTAGIDVAVSFVDITTTAATPGSQRAAVSSATTTTICAAPGASTTRQIKRITLRNTGTASNTLTVQTDVSGTNYTEIQAALAAGESLHYQDGRGWDVIDVAGRVKQQASESQGVDGRSVAVLKIGTAPEAAGEWYWFGKDSGNPGPWSPGTPGLNGRATDGTTTADAGCLYIPTPASGDNYLAGFEGSASVACQLWLFDVLWVNTGIVVTTTTAQAITPAALPARDANGATNGHGVWAGLLVTAATTNAAIISNTTISYTNQDGTAGRTATLGFPATAVIGTVCWFRLAAGDTGVRSIQSVTLGTSYVSGSVSLILARPLLSFGSLLAHVGGSPAPPLNPGVRLYAGTCALPVALASATTAITAQAVATILVR